MSIYLGEGKTIVVSDMQGPAPDGFHVPLHTEWQSIYNALTGLGLSGGPNVSTYLKLPMAGYRVYSDLSFTLRYAYGFYWSSTPYDANNAYNFGFDNPRVYNQAYDRRSYGRTVRCLQNSPTIPTSSWTTLYQGTGSAGIFHNATDGLISISSDGTNWYTLMDKNLGATTVYNYGDTMTEANCGKVFQRGNNYGFSGDANYNVSQISKSDTQVDVTGYGPGNYYESSTWITKYPRQSSANNGNNLRGGVSQGSSTIVDTGIKSVYLGDTKAKAVYVGDTKVFGDDEIVVLYSGAGGTITHNIDKQEITLTSSNNNTITIADRNVGATSYDYTSSDSYGGLYCWGAKTEGKGHTGEEDWSQSQTIAKDGYHIPGISEINNLVDLFCSITGYTRSNGGSYFCQYLLIPLAGWYRADRDGIYSVGYSFYIWSTDWWGDQYSHRYFRTDGTNIYDGSNYKTNYGHGMSVRLFKDT